MSTPRLCTIDGCGRKHYGIGLCRVHYDRQRAQRARLRDGTAWERKLTQLVDEVSALLGTDTPVHIAARVGYDKPPSLARRLARAGRLDLARAFWRAA